ncbi:acyltransferase family protein [Angustibacter aerolatus]
MTILTPPPAPATRQEARRETAARAPRSFRPDVEGLRALAVLLVVLYHAGVPRLTGGYVGVDVFFVLSGFLITGLLLREATATGTVSISGFYARRARRILPASLLVILATVVASVVLLNFVRAGQVLSDARWATAFMANLHFAATGTDYLQADVPPSPLQHYWSLAVEEQFYVVWPVLVLLVAKLAPRRLVGRAVGVVIALISVASLAWCIEQTSQAATQAYFSPFTRAWELGVGALLAAGSGWLLRLPAVVGRWLGWLGLAAVIGSAFWITDATPFPGAYALLPVLGTAAVVAAGSIAPGVGAESVLRQRPLQWLGAMSYSLYLWHWPALVIAAALVGGTLGVGPALLVVLASLLVAVLTHHAVENPLRRAPRLAARTSNSLGFGVLALVTVLFACNVMISNQLTERDAAAARAQARLASVSLDAAPAGDGKVSGVQAAVVEAAAAKRLPSDVSPPLAELPQHASPANFDGCLVPTEKTSSPSCTYGDTSASKTVVLFGDSHAAAWLSALDAAGEREHFKLLVLTKSLCPFPSTTVWNTVDKRPFSQCDAWRSWALDRIDAVEPSLVVVSSTMYGVRLPSSPKDQTGLAAAWQRGATTTLKRLDASAKRVVVLGDSPVMADDPAQCLADHPKQVQRCSQPTPEALKLSREVLQAHVAKVAKADYLPVVDWFCTPTECPMVVKGVVTHYDRWHLTADYSSLLSKPLASALRLT